MFKYWSMARIKHLAMTFYLKTSRTWRVQIQVFLPFCWFFSRRLCGGWTIALYLWERPPWKWPGNFCCSFGIMGASCTCSLPGSYGEFWRVARECLGQRNLWKVPWMAMIPTWFRFIEPQSAVWTAVRYSWSKESVGCGRLPLLEVPWSNKNDRIPGFGWAENH